MFFTRKQLTVIGLVMVFLATCLVSAQANAFADRMKALRQRMATEGEISTGDNTAPDVPNVVKQLEEEIKKPGLPKIDEKPVTNPKVKISTPKPLKKPAKRSWKSKKASNGRKGLLPVKSGWKVEADKLHAYRIQFPKNWQTSFLQDGPDRIKTGLSPDQNVSVRVRSFDGVGAASLEQIKAAFEQTVLGGGNQLHSEKGNLCGIPSIMSVYSGQFNNIDVNMVAVIMVKASKGYIVWTMIPANMFANKSAEADAVLATFEFTN